MFGERWTRILKSKGGDTALWWPGGKRSFADLDAEARRLAPLRCPRLGAYFLAQGDGHQVAVALLAGFLSGRPVQVVEADRARRVPACKPPRHTALVKQTVGSSGRRRCQFFSLDQIAADVDRLHAAMRLEHRGVAVAAVSAAHSYGLSTTLMPMLMHGLPVHWLPTPFPAGLADAFKIHARVFLPAVPAIWKAWLAAGVDLSQVTLAVSAGSPLTAALERIAWDRASLKLHNLYGASECGAISYDDSDMLRTDGHFMGRLLPGVKAAVDAAGRLQVISSSVGLGYDEPLPGEVFGRGRHLTWDRVSSGPEGLRFHECLGAGINVASRKLSPEEIAERIRAGTGVTRVRIHGSASRDPERVQDIVASIAVASEALTPAFKSKACAALAPWEIPRQWHAEAATEDCDRQPERRPRERNSAREFPDGSPMPA